LFAEDRNFILWAKMILQPTEMMECFKTHVGVSVLNGVWDIPIIMGMKPKRILGDTLENAMVNAVYWF
jgi:hypothetical protein